jgi:hypothetical protein
MVDRVEDFAKNLIHCLPEISVWLSQRYVQMMSGDVVGLKSCNIDLPPQEISMVMRLGIYF